jgi:uncharacterized protein YkwD
MRVAHGVMGLLLTGASFGQQQPCEQHRHHNPGALGWERWQSLVHQFGFGGGDQMGMIAAAPTPTKAATSMAAQPTTQPATASAAQPSATAAFIASMLAVLNQDRASVGSPPLFIDANLAASGQAHSAEMDQWNQVTHSTGSQYGADCFARMAHFGATNYSSYAENVGGRFYTAADANNAFWTQEAPTQGGHWANIKNPAYKAVGIGYVNGMVTHEFGG